MTGKYLTDEQAEDLKNSTGLVLLKLTADWCGPCRMFNPVLDKFSEETGTPVFNLDIDANPNTPRDNNVMSIPTTLVYFNGEVADRLTGALPLSTLKKNLQPWLLTPSEDRVQ